MHPCEIPDGSRPNLRSEHVVAGRYRQLWRKYREMVVLSADETAAAVGRAQAALAEIAARRAADAVREDEEEAVRRDQLARWSADDDRAAAQAATDDAAPVREQ